MAGKSAGNSSGRNGSWNGWTNSAQKRDNYNEYRFSFREWVVVAGTCTGIALAVSYVFFNSLLLGAAAALPAVLLIRKPLRRVRAERRKIVFKKQFLNAVTLLGDYLKSGYSVENAIEKSRRELEELWGNTSDVAQEWRQMAVGMASAKTVEELFRDLGERSDIEEVKNFGELFGIVKRSGGQLSSVVRNTAARLSEAFQTEEQIRTATAARRFEQRIMSLMPAGILLYIRFGSPELLVPLYTTAFGRVLMCVCLVLYAAAIVLAGRILKIRV